MVSFCLEKTKEHTILKGNQMKPKLLANLYSNALEEENEKKLPELEIIKEIKEPDINKDKSIMNLDKTNEEMLEKEIDFHKQKEDSNENPNEEENSKNKQKKNSFEIESKMFENPRNLEINIEESTIRNNSVRKSLFFLRKTIKILKNSQILA